MIHRAYLADQPSPGESCRISNPKAGQEFHSLKQSTIIIFTALEIISYATRRN